jgi:tetratricopeptide (TPR) repeat protein
VGSERCAECHAEISAAYAEHPMARSAGLAQGEGLPEGEFAVGDLRYSVRLENGVVVHREALVDADGPVYELSVPVRYVIGSGRRGRTYLIDRDGALFESPVTWYSAGRRWDLSPGYGRTNQHFDRQIGDGCLFCHVGTLNRADDEADRYGEPMFREAGIGCERCHGPGGGHVAYRTALSGDANGDDPIVNPAKLEPARREAVCEQCHLQGDERFLRYGRRETDFRPGDALHDVWISFTRGTRVIDGETTEVVSQVEQMQASRCFRESAGRFGCSSCHDPHRAPTESERADFYRKKCLACHTSPATVCAESEARRQAQEDRCVDCHMPRLGAADVPHTSQTDHRVPRRRGAGAAASGGGTASFQVFGGADKDVPDWELQRARGFLMIDYAERKRDRPLAAEALRLLKPLTERAPNDAALWTKLGAAYELASFPEQARSAFEEAMRADERAIEPRRRRAVLLFDRQAWQEAREALEDVYRRQAWDRAVTGRLILARAATGDEDQAFALAVEAVKRYPDSAQLHNWLSEAYRRRGQMHESAHHARQARRVERRSSR